MLRNGRYTKKVNPQPALMHANPILGLLHGGNRQVGSFQNTSMRAPMRPPLTYRSGVEGLCETQQPTCRWLLCWEDLMFMWAAFPGKKRDAMFRSSR